MEEIENIFARKRNDGNYDILDVENGCDVTKLDLNEYPVDSDLSTRWEHPNGIVFTLEQVHRNDIEIEDY